MSAKEAFLQQELEGVRAQLRMQASLVSILIEQLEIAADEEDYDEIRRILKEFERDD